LLVRAVKLPIPREPHTNGQVKRLRLLDAKVVLSAAVAQRTPLRHRTKVRENGWQFSASHYRFMKRMYRRWRVYEILV
jgi:hypothetical protein